MEKLNNFKHKEGRTVGFFYLMTVGVLLAWSMVANIIDTTIFARTHMLNLMRMFFIVGIFGLFFMHKYLRRIGFALLIIGLVFVTTGFLSTAEEPHLAQRFVALSSGSIDYILGNRIYHDAYETFIVWAISFFFGFFVVFFTYHKFRFWPLCLVSIVTTSLAITSPYFRHTVIFYVYVFCFLALVVTYLHQKNMKKVFQRPQSSLFINLMMPVIAIIVLFTQLMPVPQAGASEGFMNQVVRTPFEFFNTLFLDVTQPSEFSIRQVGFGGSGNRLGGDIEPNDQVFMEIMTNASMPLYLTGATRDTYTGYSWRNVHDEYRPVDFDAYEHIMDFIESELSWQTSNHYDSMDWINTGRFVQADPIEFLGDHIVYWEEENVRQLRLFIDELTGLELLLHADQTMDWYDDFSQLERDANQWMRIDNLDRRLTTLFHSGHVQHIRMDDDEVALLRNRDGAFLSEERLSQHATYSVHFREMETHLVYWWEDDTTLSRRNMLETSYHGMFTAISQMFSTFRENHGYDLWQSWFRVGHDLMTYEELLNTHLIPRVERIHDIYTALPVDFPDRVRELAFEITAEAENNYEKMRLLETFLSESFPYTLTPGPSPSDQDFVAHFLFDLQRGYCVHFATAFVVMARSLGMPTRYVEGFYVNVPFTHGSIAVLNNMAHAWPEVYFEGFGWIKFEPTPALGLLQQQGGQGFTGFEPTDREVSGQFLFDIADADDLEAPLDLPLENEYVGADADHHMDHVHIENVTIPFQVSVSVGISLLMVLVLIRATHLHVKRKRLLKKESNERMISQFEVLLDYLAVLGFDIKENETVAQFAVRIERYFSKEAYDKALLKASAVVFEKARYSNQIISKAEYRTVEKLIRRMDMRAEKELGRGKYLFYRYILGSI
ncbi:MAG: transglutaminase-like domain-containing protein [Defluviitaleaceae bacterium]|nr:transglutaminase-like domain-containing protein [Defluviitaleaceae bacterium]